MHACDYLLACDMEMDVSPRLQFTSWENGYGDFHCIPDFATLRARRLAAEDGAGPVRPVDEP